MSDCIFCKIVNGDIPAHKVYEDDRVLAFLDISQVTKGHTLVIPKEHHQDLFELPADLAAHLFSVVPAIASTMKDVFGLKGMNLLNNNGSFAGQTVFHYHLHMLPRHGEEDGFAPSHWNTHTYSQEELKEIAGTLSAKLA